MRRHWLALDIGSTTVQFLDVASNSQPYSAQVRTSGNIPISNDVVQDGEILQPAALAADLKAALKTARVLTRHTAVAINSSRLILRRLDLPPLPIPQLRQLLTWELQRYTPYPADTAEFDLLSLQLSPKQHTVLLAAIPKNIIVSLLTTLKLAGLRPFLLEPGVISLFRWTQYHYDLSSKNAVLLDLGPCATNILVVTAGQPFIARTIPVTLDGVEGKQQLVAEVRRSLDFTRTHHNISSDWYCFCAGQQQASNDLLSTLEKDLTMSVQGLRTDSSPDIDGTLFATSFGLALGWWGGADYAVQ